MSLLTNLISYWKLDEASGNAIDAHGSNNLTDWNSTGSGTGVINGARDFEYDSQQSLYHADNADLSTGDIDWTLACWVKIESNTGALAYIITKDGAEREYNLLYNEGIPGFTLYVFDSSVSFTTVSVGSISLSTWYHLVAWHDSVNNQIGMAVNAGTPNITAWTTGVKDSNADFVIASNKGSPTNYFDGLIDEVGFWKRVLSSQERTDLYNSGAGLSYDNFAPYVATYEGSGKLTSSGIATERVTAAFSTVGTLLFTGLSSLTQSFTFSASGKLTLTGVLPFTPLQVGGLKCWLKADALTLNNNDPVSTWTDSSYTGQSITTSGANRPLFKTNIINGYPVVRFDGVDDFMTMGAIGGYITRTADTIFWVGKITTVDSNNTSTYELNNTIITMAFGGIYLRTGILGRYNTVSGVENVIETSALSLNTSSIIESRHESGTVYLTVNGGSENSVSSGTMDDYGLANGQLSHNSGSLSFVDGDYAEMLIFNVAVSSGDRTLIYNYLYEKYFNVRVFSHEGLGTISVSGIASSVVGVASSAVGKLTLSGLSSVVQGYAVSATGGLRFIGLGDPSSHYTFSTLGKLSFTGICRSTRAQTFITVGTLLFRGIIRVNSVNGVHVPTGKLTFVGLGKVVIIRPVFLGVGSLGRITGLVAQKHTMKWNSIFTQRFVGIATEKTSGTFKALGRIALTGLSAVSDKFTYQSSGRLLATGIGQPIVRGVVLPSGRLSFSGVARVARGWKHNAVGAITVSGLAPGKMGWRFSAGGQVTLAGIGSMTTRQVHRVGGRINLSGIGKPGTTALVSGTGKLSLSGLSRNRTTAIVKGGGSLRINGIADGVSGFRHLATGKINFMGVSTQREAVVYRPSGKLLFVGHGQRNGEYYYDASGKIVLSGRVLWIDPNWLLGYIVSNRQKDLTVEPRIKDTQVENRVKDVFLPVVNKY